MLRKILQIFDDIFQKWLVTLDVRLETLLVSLIGVLMVSVNTVHTLKS